MEVKGKKPPGKKLMKNMSLKIKWLLFATLGLVLVGYGLCAFSEAAHEKHTGSPFTRWFLLGTYSLIVVGAGLSVFGQAIVYKSQIENRKMMKKLLKKNKKKSAAIQNAQNPPATTELKPTRMKPQTPKTEG